MKTIVLAVFSILVLSGNVTAQQERLVSKVLRLEDSLEIVIKSKITSLSPVVQKLKNYDVLRYKKNKGVNYIFIAEYFNDSTEHLTINRWYDRITGELSTKENFSGSIFYVAPYAKIVWYTDSPGSRYRSWSCLKIRRGNSGEFDCFFFRKDDTISYAGVELYEETGSKSHTVNADLTEEQLLLMNNTLLGFLEIQSTD